MREQPDLTKFQQRGNYSKGAVIVLVVMSQEHYKSKYRCTPAEVPKLLKISFKYWSLNHNNDIFVS